MIGKRHHPPEQGCAGACCLEVTNLEVKREDRCILHDINFHLHCGEIVALIGPNGGGKTSLLQSLLGQGSYSGSIRFQRAGERPSSPLIGYVPQSPSFDRGDPLTVLNFFGAAISRYPAFLPAPKSLRRRVSACLERVHGAELLDRPIGALSGGELQRVLLALALEPIPQILILDEPLSGIDVEGEYQLMEMLLKIRKQYDLSILYSTHDFSALERYADKVLLLQKELRLVGPPKAVLASQEFMDAFHLSPISPRQEGS